MAEATILLRDDKALAATAPAEVERKLTVWELLDGITPAAGMHVVVSASAPIDAFSLRCDEATASLSPRLALESQQ